MPISKRPNHSPGNFMKRTVSAQIHLFGCFLVAAGACWMMPVASRLGVWQSVAAGAFLVGGFLVFLASTTLHFLADGYDLSPDLEARFERIDHYCIYLLIAGTYSPFILTALTPMWRVPLLVCMWSFALLGILYTYSKNRLPPFLQSRPVYVSMFVLMGWMALLRSQDIYARLSTMQLGLLIAGGLSYSIGAVIYTLKWPNPWKGIFAFHEIWHVMVIMGFVFHFFMIASTFSAPNCDLSTDTLWITACAQLHR